MKINSYEYEIGDIVDWWGTTCKIIDITWATLTLKREDTGEEVIIHNPGCSLPIIKKGA